MSDNNNDEAPKQKKLGERTCEETPPEEMHLEHKARSQRNRRRGSPRVW